MKAQDISQRLNRLLDGKGSPRDFDAFFLWIRESRRSFGSKIIEDIGHFVAHSDERTKGVAWDRVSQFAAMVSFVIPRAGGSRTQTADQLRHACEAALELLPEDSVRRNFRLSKGRAKRFLAAGLKKIQSFDGTSIVWSDLPQRQEALLIERLSSVLVVENAFTEDEVLKQFVSCVRRNSLVEDSRIAQLDELRSRLSLYVIEKVHLSRIALRDGRMAELHAASTTSSDAPDCPAQISVTGSIPTDVKGSEFQMMFDIYRSTLKTDDWCSIELLIPGSLAWRMPLEIGNDWKLKLIP